MRFGSLFSGIEAASCAWLPLGWRCAWTAEIDPFACAVLRHHYPGTPNLGDVNEIEPDAVEPVDLVVFGSPCQSFSVAGKRLGLDDPRGNMALVGLRLIGRIRPRWVVWENVPGILSSDNGRDFGAFLGLLGELGYGFAYRVLDAQHAGVPQRRRRVFVVGYLGDWRPPAAVLFEQQSLRWNPPPRREAGEGIASPVASCAEGGSGYRCDADTADNLIAFSAKDHGADAGDTAPTLRAGGHDKSHANAGVMPAIAFDVTGTGPGVRNGATETDVHTALRSRPPGHSEGSTTTVIAHALRADGFDASEDGTGRGTPLVTTFDWQAGGGGADASFRGKSRSYVVDKPGRTRSLVASKTLAVMTLAIRGRGDNSELEWRDDGTSNAVVTPNGGRGGINVGAVAYGIRRDAARDGVAKTPSDDAHGRVSLRDPGFNLYEETAPTLDSAPHAVAFAQNQRGELRTAHIAPQLTTGGGKPGEGFSATMQGMSVRRLTPVECLRLMGFPDDYLDIQYRGKPAADGNKYRAIGNSMAVPVVRWIGQRIQLVDDTIREISDAEA